MQDTLFAEVNGIPITGADVKRSVKRLLNEKEESRDYVNIPNEANGGYINAEGLQHYIERIALAAAAADEGFVIDDDAINTAIYDLRTKCEDEAEWESLLNDMGLEDTDLRKELSIDMAVEAMFSSRLEAVLEPSDEDAQNYYALNKESMIIPADYTFLEIDASGRLQEAAALMAQNEGAKIQNDAKTRGLVCSLSENMPAKDLPEALQNILSELPEGKVASMPTDDGSIVLIKLLKKTESRQMAQEEVLPGLKEYLKVMQHKALADVLIEESLEKAKIIYHNTDLLKKI